MSEMPCCAKENNFVGHTNTSVAYKTHAHPENKNAFYSYAVCNKHDCLCQLLHNLSLGSKGGQSENQ